MQYTETFWLLSRGKASSRRTALPSFLLLLFFFSFFSIFFFSLHVCKVAHQGSLLRTLFFPGLVRVELSRDSLDEVNNYIYMLKGDVVFFPRKPKPVGGEKETYSRHTDTHRRWQEYGYAL